MRHSNKTTYLRVRVPPHAAPTASLRVATYVISLQYPPVQLLFEHRFVVRLSNAHAAMMRWSVGRILCDAHTHQGTHDTHLALQYHH